MIKKIIIEEDKKYNCWTCKDNGYLRSTKDKEKPFIICYKCKGKYYKK